MRAELIAGLIENLRADDVGRQHIDRELHPAEVGLDQVRQGLDRSRLGSPGKALHEDVSIGEQGDDESFDDRFLSDDGPVHRVGDCEDGFTRHCFL